MTTSKFYRTNYSITREQHTALKKISKLKTVSLSSLVREAIEDLLSKKQVELMVGCNCARKGIP